MSGPIELFSHDESDTRRIGECIAAGLRADASPMAVVVAIEGELGAGKTRLVRGIAGGLGADTRAVASPSFVVAVEHRGAESNLVHVDAWRLRGEYELATIGWGELLARKKCVVAVEWASKVAAALPEQRVDVRIESTGATERRIEIEDCRGPAELAALASALALYSPGVAKPAHRCPTCSRDTIDGSSTFPFCSQRCRMADLNRWFTGGYRVSRPASADEELSE